jgi:hypothetical protein
MLRVGLDRLTMKYCLHCVSWRLGPTGLHLSWPCPRAQGLLHKASHAQAESDCRTTRRSFGAGRVDSGLPLAYGGRRTTIILSSSKFSSRLAMWSTASCKKSSHNSSGSSSDTWSAESSTFCPALQHLNLLSISRALRSESEIRHACRRVVDPRRGRGRRAAGHAGGRAEPQQDKVASAGGANGRTVQ